MPVARRTGEMTGAAARRRRLAGGELDLTPMIDVTFLLLIFFMVASTMQSTPSLDLPPAENSQGVESAGAIVITVLDGGAGPARLILGDGRGAEGTLEQISDYVADGVAAGKRRVILKVEGDVPSGTVQEVTRRVTKIDGIDLYLGVGEARQR